MDLEKLLFEIDTSMGSLLVCMFIKMCDGNERIGLDAMREVWKSFAWKMVGEGDDGLVFLSIALSFALSLFLLLWN